MKKTALLSLIPVVLSLFSVGNAAVVQGGSVFNLDGTVPDALILDPSGSPIVSGFYSVGYFTILDTAVDAAVAINNFTLLNAAFVPVANDDFQTGIPNIAGIAAIPGATLVSNGTFDPTPAIGRTFYSYITDGSALGNTSNYALYRHDGVVVTADPLNPPVNTYQLNLDDVSPTSAKLLVGIAGGPLSQTVNGNSVSFNNTITLVPEPSTLLLSAFGVLGLLRRKR